MWGREEREREWTRAEIARLSGNVRPGGASISSRPVIDVVIDGEEYEVPETPTRAFDDGQKLGRALAIVCGTGPNVDIRQATELGRWFARIGGYQQLDPGLEFVTGFIQGLQDGGRAFGQIAGPTTDAG